MGDNALPLLNQDGKVDAEKALETKNEPKESLSKCSCHSTRLVFLWLLEIVWNIIGIILIASHRNNQLYFLLILLLFFMGVYPCMQVTCLCQLGLIEDLRRKRLFNFFGSLTITSLLIFDAYYNTNKTEYYGTNFTLAYSYGFVIFSAASFAYIKTNFFSISDFMMRIQFAKYIASVLDAFSLAQMLEGRPWDSLSISVFSFFIIANGGMIIMIWLPIAHELRKSMNYVFDDLHAKSFRHNLLMISITLVDIPFLVIRLVGYFNFGIQVSSFVVKNVINILASCKEYYSLDDEVNEFKKNQLEKGIVENNDL
jgi:hypothetical protein